MVDLQMTSETKHTTHPQSPTADELTTAVDHLTRAGWSVTPLGGNAFMITDGVTTTIGITAVGLIAKARKVGGMP